MVKHSSNNVGNLLVHNTALNFFGQLAPIITGILTIPFIIRRLGVDGFGILSLSWVVMGNLTIFNLGISRAVTKFMAESLGNEEMGDLPHIVWSSVYFQAVLGILGGILLAALSPYLVTKVFNIPQNQTGETIRIFYLIAASVPFFLLSETFSGVLQAAQRFGLVNAVRIPITVAAFLLPAAALLCGYNLFGVVVMLLLSKIAGFFAYFVLCIRHFPTLRKDFSIHPGKIKEVLIFGGWLTVSNLISPIFLYFERFFIVSILSVEMLAFYSAPFEMISRIIVFPASLALTIFPAFSYYGKDNGRILSEIFSRSLKCLIFVMVPASLFFFVFAKDVLSLWLGNEFAVHSAAVFQILTVVFFLNALAYVPLSAIQGLGRADLNAKLELVLAPIFMFLLFVFIRAFGLNGAGLAKLAAMIIDLVGLLIFAEKVGGLSIRNSSFGTLRPVLTVSLMLACASFLLMACHALIMKASIFTILVILYVFLFWRAGFDSTDKRYIKNFYERVRI